MALLRTSLALAASLICMGASAQERESPFGGGPVVYGHDPAGLVAVNAPDAASVGQDTATAADEDGLRVGRGRRSGMRGGRGGRGPGGHGGPGGGRSGRK